MPLEAAFAELETKARLLQEKVEGMSAPLVKDVPRYNVPHLVQRLYEAVVDLRESVAGMVGTAVRAKAAGQHPADLNAARHSLSTCQARFHEAWEVFDGQFMSVETIAQLLELGQTTHSAEEREQWAKWRASLRQGIEQCRVPLHEMSRALGACWEEIAERAGAVTNIGQQIQMAARPGAGWEIET